MLTIILFILLLIQTPSDPEISARQTDVYRYSIVESGFNSPVEVAIGYDFKKDGIMYRIIPEEGCVTVCAIDSTMKGVIVLPPTVTADDGKKYYVTAIGMNENYFWPYQAAFASSGGIDSIVIPEGVKTIGSYSFAFCHNLESIEIPSSVEYIGSKAFERCTNLKNVTINGTPVISSNDALQNTRWMGEQRDAVILKGNLIWQKGFLNPINTTPEGVVTICSNAYDNNPPSIITVREGVRNILPDAFHANRKVILPSTVETLAINVFMALRAAGDEYIDSIFIPRNVNNLVLHDMTGAPVKDLRVKHISVDPLNSEYSSGENGNYVMRQSDSTLIIMGRNAIIPDGIKKIGSNVFRWKHELTEISIPSSVEEIGGYAFEGCRNLQTVILPDKMERIDEGAFARCEKIQDITFPDNIKEIGSFSFWLTGLSDIFIPENVSYIGDGAFASCQNLERIVVDKRNRKYKNDRKESAIIRKKGKKLVAVAGNAIIPDNIKEIGKGVFCYNDNLTTLHIPSKVEKIDDGAFEGCSNLREVWINKRLRKIGKEVFSYCRSLTDVYIPESSRGLFDAELFPKNTTIHVY